MDQPRRDQARTCQACGGSRWWRSRTGWRVCAVCHPDAWEALQMLAAHVNPAPPSGGGRGEATSDVLSRPGKAEASAPALLDTQKSFRPRKGDGRHHLWGSRASHAAATRQVHPGGAHTCQKEDNHA
jgi:hypothetical protein